MLFVLCMTPLVELVVIFKSIFFWLFTLQNLFIRLDENLKWISSDYGNIDDIRVRVDEVFRPDITLINSVDNENVIRTSTHSDMILWNTGEMFWMPAISMKTICDVDLSEWPFDQQTCIYRFASWTYDGDSLDLRNACKLVK